MIVMQNQIVQPFTTSSYVQSSANQRLMEIGRVFSDPEVLTRLENMSKLARIGASVKAASRKPRNRKHELGDLIERTYAALAADGHEPSTEEVLAAIEAKTTEDTVQEVHGGVIYWIDGRNKEHKMKVSTLRNRLTEIRNRHSQS